MRGGPIASATGASRFNTPGQRRVLGKHGGHRGPRLPPWLRGDIGCCWAQTQCALKALAPIAVLHARSIVTLASTRFAPGVLIGHLNMLGAVLVTSRGTARRRSHIQTDEMEKIGMLSRFETLTACMHRSALRAKTYCDVDFNNEFQVFASRASGLKFTEYAFGYVARRLRRLTPAPLFV